jgi:hypothetical protein
MGECSAHTAQQVAFLACKVASVRVELGLAEAAIDGTASNDAGSALPVPQKSIREFAIAEQAGITRPFHAWQLP